MQPVRRIRTIRHMADDSDQIVASNFGGRLNSPVIFSKQLLFGNGNSEVLSSNDDLESAVLDDDDNSESKKRLKGAPMSPVHKYQYLSFMR